MEDRSDGLGSLAGAWVYGSARFTAAPSLTAEIDEVGEWLTLLNPEPGRNGGVGGRPIWGPLAFIASKGCEGRRVSSSR